MAMDHVRRIGKLDPARGKAGMSGPDVRHLEIQDRFALLCAIALGQEQPRPAAIEKGQVAKRIKMRQAKRLAIPSPCRRNVLDAAGDLADRADAQCFTHLYLPGEK